MLRLCKCLLQRSAPLASRRMHAAAPVFRAGVLRTSARPALPWRAPAQGRGARPYSGSVHLSLSDCEEGVLKVLRNFDKVDQTKLALTTSFTQMGLDSLDAVEVMIAVEEEFHLEIPDAVADKAQTPKEIAAYIHSFLNPHEEKVPEHLQGEYSERPPSH